MHEQPESKKLKCKLHFFSTVEHFTSCHLLILQNNTLLKPKFNGFSVTETIVALFMFYWGKKRWYFWAKSCVDFAALVSVNNCRIKAS